jgi:hypothetical protein
MLSSQLMLASLGRRSSVRVGFGSLGSRPSTLSMNDPPTALVGFGEARVGLFCRLSMNKPPTALVGWSLDIPLGNLQQRNRGYPRSCVLSIACGICDARGPRSGYLCFCRIYLQGQWVTAAQESPNHANYR